MKGLPPTERTSAQARPLNGMREAAWSQSAGTSARNSG